MDDPVLHIGPQLKRTMRSLYRIPDDALRVPQGMHVLNKSKDSFMALYKQFWDYHYGTPMSSVIYRRRFITVENTIKLIMIMITVMRTFVEN